MAEMITTKLNDGQTVLAKRYKGKVSAFTFANRKQAEKRVEKLGGGEIIGTCPFYVVPPVQLIAQAPDQKSVKSVS